MDELFAPIRSLLKGKEPLEPPIRNLLADEEIGVDLEPEDSSEEDTDIMKLQLLQKSAIISIRKHPALAEKI